jgi:hypothetical protein
MHCFAQAITGEGEALLLNCTADAGTKGHSRGGRAFLRSLSMHVIQPLPPTRCTMSFRTGLKQLSRPLVYMCMHLYGPQTPTR